MRNTKKINTFNNDNSNIAHIKTQHYQIMTAITNGVSKFEVMIKITIVIDKYIVYCY